MVKCCVTYSDGRSAWTVSRCEHGFRGAFCGVATDPRVGREVEAVQAMDVVRPRSTAASDCMGGVDSECVDDVGGCPAIVLEKRLSGDGV
jgi:hypothetical protein